MKPGKHKSSKQGGQDLCWKDHAHPLFWAYIYTMHELCNCNVSQLVRLMNTHNHLLYFVRFCARSTPKIVNKKKT